MKYFIPRITSLIVVDNSTFACIIHFSVSRNNEDVVIFPGMKSSPPAPNKGEIMNRAQIYRRHHGSKKVWNHHIFIENKHQSNSVTVGSEISHRSFLTWTRYWSLGVLDSGIQGVLTFSGRAPTLEDISMICASFNLFSKDGITLQQHHPSFPYRKTRQYIMTNYILLF